MLTEWLRSSFVALRKLSARSPRRTSQPRRYVLCLEPLEERTVLSATSLLSTAAQFHPAAIVANLSSAVATHYSLTLPQNAPNGKPVVGVITALDALNRTVVG